MATNKPMRWQNWIVYALVGTVMTVGPYVGGYLFLAEYCSVDRSVNGSTVVTRAFKYDAMRIGFAPLAWAESRLRVVVVRMGVLGGTADYYFDKSLLKNKLDEHHPN